MSERYTLMATVSKKRTVAKRVSDETLNRVRFFTGMSHENIRGITYSVCSNGVHYTICIDGNGIASISPDNSH